MHPTLKIVALALPQADHIEHELKAGTPLRNAPTEKLRRKRRGQRWHDQMRGDPYPIEGIIATTW